MIPQRPFVSRAGEKLAAALRAFDLDVTGWICADFGSHVGGFVDCLLQRGAARVYAVDTGHGVLDYRLRKDSRVVVCERTNAMRFTSPELCDLVTIDVGWTPLRLVLPAARRCLARQESAQRAGHRVIALVKPQYEAPREWLRDGVLPPDRLGEVLETVRADLRTLAWQIVRETESPLRGHGGNTEFLWLLSPT